jgi:hypothetical protein
LDGGYHGFSLTTPATLKDNQIHSIYVRYGGTTINLGSDPRTIQCDSSSPSYQYYYTDTLQATFGSKVGPNDLSVRYPGTKPDTQLRYRTLEADPATITY